MVDPCNCKLTGSLLLIVLYLFSRRLSDSIVLITNLTSLPFYNGYGSNVRKDVFLSNTIDMKKRLIIDFGVTNRVITVVVSAANVAPSLNVVLSMSSPHEKNVSCLTTDRWMITFNCSGIARFLIVAAHVDVRVEFMSCMRYPVYMESYHGCYVDFGPWTVSVAREIDITDCMTRCRAKIYLFAGLLNSECFCVRELYPLTYMGERCESLCPSVVDCFNNRYLSLFYTDESSIELVARLLSYQLKCAYFQNSCPQCPSGLEGITCHMRDCSKNSGNCGRGSCLSYAWNTLDGGFCRCPRGYVSIPTEECHDLDECKIFKPCDPLHGHCQNTKDSYVCSCSKGFKQVKDRCHDIDECQLDPCNSTLGKCENIMGSYHCRCFLGYRVTSNTVCKDIDECSFESTCGASGRCVNHPGSFTCVCHKGFRAESGTRCVDIDECKEYGKCDLSTATCSNSFGSYACVCKQGYEKISRNYNCSDMDECARMINICDLTISKCRNAVGDYSCECFAGYSRGITNKDCVDYDECVRFHLCDPSSTTCVNIVGSYQCACLVGYELYTKYKCIDIDECLGHLNFCDKDTTCMNTQGSYKCDCDQGLKAEVDHLGVTCEDIDECFEGHNCKSQTSVCINQRKGYQCICKVMTGTFSTECTTDIHFKKETENENREGEYTAEIEAMDFPDNFSVRYVLIISSLFLFLIVAMSVIKSALEESDNIVHEDDKENQADQSGWAEMFEEAKTTEI